MKSKLLVVFFVLLAACNTANKPLTDEQKATVREEGTVVVKEFFDDMTQMNGEKLTVIMENSADFNFIVGGDVYNYEQFIELSKQYLPMVESQTFDIKFEQYVVVDPECFIYTWKGRNGARMKSGEEVMMEDYSGTYAFRKNKEGWKLFVGHESEKVPLPIDTTKKE
jgi:co-chaperonin GroES (HSP10)